jgi:hypothetical protein
VAAPVLAVARRGAMMAFSIATELQVGQLTSLRLRWLS